MYNEQVQEEAQEIEIGAKDLRNISLKNLLVVRALTCKNDFPQLKEFMQEVFKDPQQ